MIKSEFDKIFIRNYGYLITVMKNKFGDVEFAKEIVNHTYAHLASRLDKVPAMENEKRFLIQVAKRQGYNTFKRKRLPVVDIEYETEGECNLDRDIFKKQLQEMVAKDLFKLPPKRANAIQSIINNDGCNKKLSDKIGVNYNTFKANYKQGLDALRPYYLRRRELYVI